MRNICRYFFWSLSWIPFCTGFLPAQIKVTDVDYEGHAHFLIETPAAIYYLDKAGGGVSRMIDQEGNDWVGFSGEPWDQYPASAASAYRGIPNFVFGSQESGAGHPGHAQCTSDIVGENRILTSSKSGNWQWEWTFYDDYAKIDMLQVDPDHPYWFLYEGTPGGRFEPSKHYFGSNQGGPSYDQWDYYKGDIVFDQFQWAYFGHQEVDRVLFIAQTTKDTLMDTFAYLGNTEQGIDSPDGMVVFGFGRKEGAQPLMHSPNTFILGFIEKKVENEKDHKEIEQLIQSFPE